MKKNNHAASCCHSSSKPWFKEPLFLTGAVIFLVWLVHLGLSFSGINLLAPLFQKFFQYLKIAWWAIGLGFLIGGLIEVLIPENLMAYFLGKGKKSIFIAVLLGFLASACSHGILAIAVSLYKKGASTAATLAFLLAAPWANLAITVLLFALFGVKALLIIGGAILVAIISGLILQILEQKGFIEGRKEKKDLTIKNIAWYWPGWLNLIKKLLASFASLAKMILWWVLIGFFLASILGSFIPESFMNRFFGANFLGMLATLGLATVVEICSEGSAPLAFEIWQKTGAFGNVFVFLMAGVVTDFTEFGIVMTNIGKKAAIALMVVSIPLVLLLGFLFNNLL